MNFYWIPSTEELYKKTIFFGWRKQAKSQCFEDLILLEEQLISAIFSVSQNSNVEVPRLRGLCDYIERDLETKTT